MATTNSVQLKFAYKNTDKTRTYTLDNVATAALPNVKSKVVAINNTLAGEFSVAKVRLAINFVADEYDETTYDGDGHMTGISEATIIQKEVEKIPLFE